MKIKRLLKSIGLAILILVVGASLRYIAEAVSRFMLAYPKPAISIIVLIAVAGLTLMWYAILPDEP
jgi:hypothetical protein